MATRAGRSAGFSLVEALTALAIAAMLAAVLTRMVSNTRMSAGKIRELVEMITLGDSLLEQISLQNPGTTSGRSAGFAWRISVSPATFTATARRVNAKGPAANQSTPALGLVADSDSSHKEQTSASQHTIEWIPFRVNILVESPSGRKYAADTISIGPRPAPEAHE